MKWQPRPPGGNKFEAVQISPEGWLCLAPWVQTPDGQWWRPHIEGTGKHGDQARKWAEHMAAELNRAVRRGRIRFDPVADSL